MVNQKIFSICFFLTVALFSPVLAEEIAETAKEPAKENAAPNSKKETTGVESKKDTPKKKKAVIKLAEDEDNSSAAPPEIDPKDYNLKNPKMITELSGDDRHPWDRGEHLMISAFFGALGGAGVGAMIGLSGYDKNDMTTTQNKIFLGTGIGAGVGALSGITVSFFERGRYTQFGIGKFLWKYAWYGTLGGAALGAGVGFIPYSSSNDYSDLFKYAGYGAAVGLAAGITLFFFDLPEHLKIYAYRRNDQEILGIAWVF